MGVQKRAGEDHDPFERVIEHLKDERYGNDNFPTSELTVDDLKELVQRFKDLIKERTGKAFPQDPREQLWGAIGAVFGSWKNDRAMVYRRKYGIPHDWGTAVNVQTMVFGNMGEDQRHGRRLHPRSGQRRESFLRRISDQRPGRRRGRRRAHAATDRASSPREMPDGAQGADESPRDCSRSISRTCRTSSSPSRDKLYILQTRNGKRTGLAAVRIAVDMVGRKTDHARKQPSSAFRPTQLGQLLAPIFDRKSIAAAKKDRRADLPAGPGAASGHVVLQRRRSGRARWSQG